MLHLNNVPPNVADICRVTFVHFQSLGFSRLYYLPKSILYCFDRRSDGGTTHNTVGFIVD